MKKALLLLPILVLLAAGCASSPDDSSQKKEQAQKKLEEKAVEKDKSTIANKAIPPVRPTSAAGAVKVQAKTVVVNITAAGFAPREVAIKKGDSVKWINASGAGSWPASAVHPTHTVYPTTGGCLGSTFDACKALGQNESWTFKFDVAGSWAYHDHVNPSRTGKVVVQ